MTAQASGSFGSFIGLNVTGNLGAIVPSDANANVNILGTGSVVTTGNSSANTLTISAGFTQIPWTDKAASFNAAAGNGYFITANATATLPASPSQGNDIEFAVDAATTTLTIQANTGQTIRLGTAVSASAGTCASNNRGDSIRLVFRSSDSSWIAIGAPQGTWVIT